MSGDRCDLLCLDLPHAEQVRSVLPSVAALEAVAARAKALADPCRLRIAVALRAGEMCVCDLAWVCGLAQNLVSHHLRVLRQTGLAHSRREGKLVIYRLSQAGAELLDVLAAEPVTP